MGNPRIMVAATKSGSGKTSITCGLLQALKMRNQKVSAFKCGPDYIDPMFHQKVIEVPSKNLDLFFTDEKTTRQLFLKNNESDISVIEGVMGVYDGVGGITKEASSYHLAEVLNAPILLVVDAKGMGRSLLAQIRGFLDMDEAHLIQGILLNRISATFYRMVKPMIEEELSVKVLGYLPDDPKIRLESRYLGLKLPEEIKDLKAKTEYIAGCLEETMDLDEIIRMAKATKALEKRKLCIKKQGPKLRIGVAMDEAFCFYYTDNLSMLRETGAEIVPFSPLKDQELPEKLDGLILGGGYPELFAKQLEANVSIRKELRKKIEEGLPTLAECGGFLYLHEQLRTKEGERYEMVGAVLGECFYQEKMRRFGYIEIYEKEVKYLKPDQKIRGHEYHYYESENPGADCIAKKPYSGRTWECIHKQKQGWYGFAHLYYPSEPTFIESFLKECEIYGNARKKMCGE